MQRVLVTQVPVVGVGDAQSLAVAAPQTPQEIFATYSRYVLQIACRMLGRQSDAEDVAQDVFALVIVKLDKVLAARSVRVWLASATVRCCLHALRKRRLMQRLGLEDAVDYDQLLTQLTSGEELQVLLRTLRTLDSMPDELRVVWTLRYVEGESIEDLAAILSCSRSTVKRRLERADRELKKKLGAGHD